jgi:hypothetical protein
MVIKEDKERALREAITAYSKMMITFTQRG